MAADRARGFLLMVADPGSPWPSPSNPAWIASVDEGSLELKGGGDGWEGVARGRAPLKRITDAEFSVGLATSAETLDVLTALMDG